MVPQPATLDTFPSTTEILMSSIHFWYVEKNSGGTGHMVGCSSVDNSTVTVCDKQEVRRVPLCATDAIAAGGEGCNSFESLDWIKRVCNISIGYIVKGVAELGFLESGVVSAA